MPFSIKGIKFQLYMNSESSYIGIVATFLNPQFLHNYKPQLQCTKLQVFIIYNMLAYKGTGS